jgi:hypothetical protein
MEIFLTGLDIILIAMAVFLLIPGGIYISHRLRFSIERRGLMAEHDRRKLKAQQELDDNIFYENLGKLATHKSP